MRLRERRCDVDMSPAPGSWRRVLILALLAGAAGLGCTPSKPSSTPSASTPSSPLPTVSATATPTSTAAATASVTPSPSPSPPVPLPTGTAAVAASNERLTEAQHTVDSLETLLSTVDAGLAANQATEGDVTGASGVRACDAAVDRRVGALGSARRALESSPHLSSADRNALEGQIDAAVSGLRALRSTIDADPPARLAADCRNIVTGYRVIGLLVPKVQLAAAADRALGNGDTLTGLAALLQQRVDVARGRGKNVAAAQGDVTAIGGKVTEAASAVGGVPAMVLPLDAPGYPANRRTLVAARGSLSAARRALLDALISAGNASDRLRLLG